MATWKKWLLRIAGAWLLVIGSISTIGAGLSLASLLLGLPRLIDMFRAMGLMASRGNAPLPFEVLAGLSILFTAFMVVWGVGCTVGGVGFIRRTGYGRWLSLFASGSIPLVSLAAILLLGPAALRVHPPALQLLATLPWVAVLGVCLWGPLWRDLGARAKHFKRTAVWGLAVATLIPLAAAAWMFRLKQQIAPHLPQYVERHSVAVLEPPAEYTKRPIVGGSLALPRTWRIRYMSVADKLRRSATIYDPQQLVTVMITRPASFSKTLVSLPMFRALDPYDALRAFYQPQWGVAPLLLSSLAAFGDEVHLLELDGTHWRAIARVGQNAHRTQYDVACFEREQASQSAELVVITRPAGESSLTEQQVLGIVSSFRFEPFVVSRDEWVPLAERRRGDLTEAQFALTALHEQDPLDHDVALALAKVSVDLGEWLCAKEALRQATQADSPRREEAQALLEQIEIARKSAQREPPSHAQAN